MLPVGIIIFIVIYALILCLYFYTETSGNLKLRAPNKIALALMFFIFGAVYAISKKPLELIVVGSTPLFIVALFLAMLGDIFLLFSFSTGAHFFAAGNIAFVAFEATVLINYGGCGINNLWWVFLVIPALWSIYPILSRLIPEKFPFGKDKSSIYFYMATIISSGTMGIAITSFIPTLRLLGIGMILFMLSDFDIILHKYVFPKNKWVHRLNSALYFTGMLLIVLNVAMLTL